MRNISDPPTIQIKTEWRELFWIVQGWHSAHEEHGPAGTFPKVAEMIIFCSDQPEKDRTIKDQPVNDFLVNY